MHSYISRISALTFIAISCLLISGSAVAADQCVNECRAGSKDCLSEARDAFHVCSDGFAGDLRIAFRAACFTRDRDVEACREAAEALKFYVTPCKEGLFEDVGFCRDEVTTCIEETCGVEDPFQRLLEKLSQYKRR